MIKISFEYGANLFWEYSDKGLFLENYTADHYDLPDSLVIELNELERIFQSTLNQSYPPDSGFESKKAEQDFFDRARLAFREIDYNLSHGHKLVFPDWNKPAHGVSGIKS